MPNDSIVSISTDIVRRVIRSTETDPQHVVAWSEINSMLNQAGLDRNLYGEALRELRGAALRLKQLDPDSGPAQSYRITLNNIWSSLGLPAEQVQSVVDALQQHDERLLPPVPNLKLPETLIFPGIASDARSQEIPLPYGVPLRLKPPPIGAGQGEIRHITLLATAGHAPLGIVAGWQLPEEPTAWPPPKPGMWMPDGIAVQIATGSPYSVSKSTAATTLSPRTWASYKITNSSPFRDKSR